MSELQAVTKGCRPTSHKRRPQLQMGPVAPAHQQTTRGLQRLRANCLNASVPEGQYLGQHLASSQLFLVPSVESLPGKKVTGVDQCSTVRAAGQASYITGGLSFYFDINKKSRGKIFSLALFRLA